MTKCSQLCETIEGDGLMYHQSLLVEILTFNCVYVAGRMKERETE